MGQKALPSCPQIPSVCMHESKPSVFLPLYFATLFNHTLQNFRRSTLQMWLLATKATLPLPSRFWIFTVGVESYGRLRRRCVLTSHQEAFTIQPY